VRRPRPVEKTVAAPPWKMLRISHFRTATTAARSLMPTRRKALKSYYEARGNRGKLNSNWGSVNPNRLSSTFIMVTSKSGSRNLQFELSLSF
jgi:hypothetical protein